MQVQGSYLSLSEVKAMGGKVTYYARSGMEIYV